VGKEKRKEQRLKHESKITFEIISKEKRSHDKKIFLAVTEDISVDGVKILTDTRLPINTLLRINLSLAKPQKLISATGKVKWIKSLYNRKLYDMGLEFVNTPSAVVMDLIEYMFERQRGHLKRLNDFDKKERDQEEVAEEEEEKKEATFESDELEKIPDAETKEREETEKFLEEVKKDTDFLKKREIRNKKILIVDYEKDSLDSLTKLLQAEGLQIATATDGLSGLYKFKTEKPDLVILEILLPKMHGLELCDEIVKESNKDIPIIIYTSLRRNMQWRNEVFCSIGVSGYFNKRVDEEELMNTIFNLLGVEKKKN